MLSHIDEDKRRAAYIHLYGVSQGAVLIAKKRGLNVEIAQVCGLLHDFATYKTGEISDHAHKGAALVAPLLEKTQLFCQGEINLITTAVYNHSDKDKIGGEYDELLKDADILQHIFYNISLPVRDYEQERYERLRKEFTLD